MSAGDRDPGVEECRVGRAAQQAIELVQLAALALPSHPASLRLVPDATPVQQEETIGTFGGRMAAVEPDDAGGGRRHEVGVSRVGLRVGVRPVRQEREMHGAAGIGEIVHFQPLKLLVDGRAGRQQRRDGDEGPQLRRHARPELEAGQQHRAEAAGDRPIDQQQRGIDRRQKTDQDHRRALPAGEADLCEHEQRQEENDRGREGDARDVACDPRGGEASPQGEAGRTEPHGPLEGGPATTDEMIARIALPLIAVHGRATTRRPRARGARSPLLQGRCRGRSARSRCGRGCVWQNPWRRSRCRHAARRRPDSPPRTASPNRHRRSGACW